MKMTIENWMLLTINSNKELVTRGTDISKKFYKTLVYSMWIGSSCTSIFNINDRRINAWMCYTRVCGY